MNHSSTRSLMDRRILLAATFDSFRKLDPRTQLRNPVMFAVYIGSIFTTVLWLNSITQHQIESPWFIFGVTLWLWATVLFANFSEAIAEGHGKAQADSLKKSRTQVLANRLVDRPSRSTSPVAATELKVGDLVLVQAGEVIPADGEVIEGVASVDEAAITGESAPVVRESGGDRKRSNWGHASDL
ncbi:MAG: hypothetical protein U0930_12185 [Pirellulales bacterium]